MSFVFFKKVLPAPATPEDVEEIWCQTDLTALMPDIYC